MGDIELHRQIVDEIHELFKAKNSDYSNSFSQQYQEFGLLSAVIRLSDKLNRLKSLLNKDAQVNESIDDTLLDLAGYAVLTLVERRREE